MSFILGAFLLRLVVGQYAAGGLDRPYVGDETSYGGLAERLAAGQGFVNEDGTPHSSRTPLIPFLVSLLYRLTGPNVTAARVLMCLLTTGLVPACYALGSAVGGRRVGLLATAGATLLPNWTFFSSGILTDLGAALAVALLCWLLIAGRQRNSAWWFGAAGLAWGAGVLVRPTLLAFAPAIMFWLVLVLPTWRRRIRAVVFTFLAGGLIVAPWTLRNMVALDRFVLVSSQGGWALWMGNNPASTGILYIDNAYFNENADKVFPPEDYADAVAHAAAFNAAAKQFIRDNPERFARLCVIRFKEFWKVCSPRVDLMKNVMMLASLGVAMPFFLLWAALRGWRRGPEMLLVLFIASQTAVHTVFTAIVRYRIPVEPLILVLAASGFLWIVDRFRKHRAANDRPADGAAATGLAANS